MPRWRSCFILGAVGAAPLSSIVRLEVMKRWICALTFWPLTATVAIFGCSPAPHLASGTGSSATPSRSGPAAEEQASVPPSDIDPLLVDPILGIIPESEPDLPSGTAVWIRSKDKLHSLSEFAKVARQRIASEEQSPLAASTHVQVILSPQSKEAFAEVMIGGGIGTPHWVVTMDRQLKVTSYRKTWSKDW